MPPSFSVALNAVNFAVPATLGIIPFNYAISESIDFNTATNNFTVPSGGAGTYSFAFSLAFTTGATIPTAVSPIIVNLAVGGRAFATWNFISATLAINTLQTQSGLVTIPLLEGDVVALTIVDAVVATTAPTLAILGNTVPGSVPFLTNWSGHWISP